MLEVRNLVVNQLEDLGYTEVRLVMAFACLDQIIEGTMALACFLLVVESLMVVDQEDIQDHNYYSC